MQGVKRLFSSGNSIDEEKDSSYAAIIDINSL
jgi:hypothetical protein